MKDKIERLLEAYLKVDTILDYLNEEAQTYFREEVTSDWMPEIEHYEEMLTDFKILKECKRLFLVAHEQYLKAGVDMSNEEASDKEYAKAATLYKDLDKQLKESLTKGYSLEDMKELWEEISN